MMVAAGSGCVCGSHSVAMRVVERTSLSTENPLSFTPALIAASRNSVTSALISREGRIVLDEMVFVMMISLSLLISSICLFTSAVDAFSDSMRVER